jgi:DNA-binding beta-propeller fold protein YncE
MTRGLHLLLAALVLTGAGVAAQTPAAIRFDAVDPLTYPINVPIGEVAGVASNSKGEIVVYTRTGHPTISIGTARAFSHGGSRLFQFDRSGKFTREIGQDTYAFQVAQQVRVDAEDNIWTVDQMSNTIIKFDPAGQIVMLLGRKAEADRVPALPLAAPGAAPTGGGGRRGGGAGPPGSGQPQDLFVRPSDIAWDAAGNIYVADGLGTNSRIAKFDKVGKFVKSWGSAGSAPGQFSVVHGIAIDAKGLVYVADTGNKRIQVFDADGAPKAEIANIGAPAAICITRGAHQYLYASNSNPPEDIDTGGEIYKLELDGKVLGQFGRAGKPMKEFGTVNAIDCRSEDELLVGELGNWRVQKLALHP